MTGIWQADDDGVLNPANVRLVPGGIIPKAIGSSGLTLLQAPGRFDVSNQSELEVAKQYATIGDLQAVERRLTDHLLDLENRLTFMLEAGQRTGFPWPYVAVERSRADTDVDAD